MLLQVFEKARKSMQKATSKVVLFGPRSVRGRPRVDCDTFPVDFGRCQKLCVFWYCVGAVKNRLKLVVAVPGRPPERIGAPVQVFRRPRPGAIIKETGVTNQMVRDLPRQWAGGLANF